MKKLLTVLLVGLILGLSSSAFAAVLPIGDVFNIGSWGQSFNESGVGNFNQLAVWSLTGAGFEQPAFRNFSAAGWTNYGATIDNAYALGSSPTTNMNFDIGFNGLSSSPLSFLFMASEDLVVKEWAVASWNGSAWNFSTPTKDILAGKGPTAAVPEPATMSLLGLGLLGLLRGRRKI